MTEIYRGRSIAGGVAEGEALVSHAPLSFFGGVDPDTGVVYERGHELLGQKLAGKVLVLPPLKGSTASAWVIARIAENKVAPAAIIIAKADVIAISGAIIGRIPMIDNLPFDATTKFKTGQRLKVDGDKGTVEVVGQEH